MSKLIRYSPKKILRGYLIFVFAFFVPVVQASQISLIDTRFSVTKDNTRVVLILTGLTSYRSFTLNQPDRVVVDINNTHVTTPLKGPSLQGSIIKAIRYADKGDGNLRIVFDLKQGVKPTTSLLKSGPGANSRLVMDFSSKSITNSSQSKQTKTEDYVSNSQRDIPSIETTSRLRHKDLIVVIDPGHGGKDPGAMGPHGIREKDVVLAIARDLQWSLNHIPGVKADLTRKGDYYIGLRERLMIARQDKADLFVAVHADAYNRRKDAEGASVYALSDRGATSEAARWLAERENYSELGGVKDFADKSLLVRSVLLDLSQTATITQSLQVGGMLLSSLHWVTSLHHGIVEQARFVVLKSPDIPSLLVETGFITNPYEEHRLNNPWYQEKLAWALARGIQGYFREDPPREVAYKKHKL